MSDRHRAYSVLEEKTFREDEDFVYIRGMASTPTPDRMGDIVEPMGAKFVTPMPLLLYHGHQLPVGNMTFAQPQKHGIPFEAAIPKVKEPGRVKDRVDEAIHSLKYKLISAVSIGFKPVEGEVERLKSGGLRFKIWEWYELSLVVIPAQAEAVLDVIRSFDREHLPSAGNGVSAGDAPAAKAVAPRGPVVLTARRKHSPVSITRKAT